MEDIREQKVEYKKTTRVGQCFAFKNYEFVRECTIFWRKWKTMGL